MNCQEKTDFDTCCDLFSRVRLRSYPEIISDPINAYNNKVQLGEALYPSLHYLEISLRNRINQYMCKIFNDTWLLDVPSSLRVPNHDLEKINKIKILFGKEKKRLPTNDDILSRLTFGFWVSLFSKRYETQLWHTSEIYQFIFPHLIKRNKFRWFVDEKLLKVKKVRNRVAHHEFVPLSHMTDAHKSCIDILSYMSNDLVSMLATIDRYPQIENQTLTCQSKTLPQGNGC